MNNVPSFLNLWQSTRQKTIFWDHINLKIICVIRIPSSTIHYSFLLCGPIWTTKWAPFLPFLVPSSQTLWPSSLTLSDNWLDSQLQPFEINQALVSACTNRSLKPLISSLIYGDSEVFPHYMGWEKKITAELRALSFSRLPHSSTSCDQSSRFPSTLSKWLMWYPVNFRSYLKQFGVNGLTPLL